MPRRRHPDRRTRRGQREGRHSRVPADVAPTTSGLWSHTRPIAQPPASLLAHVTVPTYFLWGVDDPVGGSAVARLFAQQLPAAELDMLPDAGHAPWIDDPDDVADRVGGFLRAAV